MKKKTPTRKIHIGGTGPVPVITESRWTVEQRLDNSADVSQEIVTPSERWRIVFGVEQYEHGESPLKRLFGPDAVPPFIVAIFGIDGNSPPAHPIRLDDGTCTTNAICVRLNTGDEFIAPMSVVEPLEAQDAFLKKIDQQTTPEAFEDNYNRTLHNRDPRNNRPGPKPKYTKQERRDAVDAMRVLVKQGSGVTEAVEKVQMDKGLWAKDSGYWRDEYYRLMRKPKKKPHT